MANPTVEKPTKAKDTDLIPMGASELQLAVPEVPGFVLYWFADRPGRIVRAQRQGWVFVKSDEVDIPNFKTIAGDTTVSGNSDLGSRVSVYGHTDERGAVVNLYLMKISDDKWKELEASREQQSDRVVDAIMGSRIGGEQEVGEGGQRRYSPKFIKNTIFQKKR